MSIATWKTEFYPEEPQELLSAEAAVLHALRKWAGLTPQNLEKHGLKVKGGKVTEIDGSGKAFLVNHDSCALCKVFLQSEGEASVLLGLCGLCPLQQTTGESCFRGPAQTFFDTNDAVPMLLVLEETLRHVQSGAFEDFRQPTKPVLHELPIERWVLEDDPYGNSAEILITFSSDRPLDIFQINYVENGKVLLKRMHITSIFDLAKQLEEVKNMIDPDMPDSGRAKFVRQPLANTKTYYKG